MGSERHLTAWFFVICGLFIGGPLAQAQSCEMWSAQIIAAEGTVELQRSDQARWVSTGLGERLCSGDSIRVQPYSRAALLLRDESVLRLDQNTTLRFPEPEDSGNFWIDLLTGVIHVISRDPRTLKFTTPFANAGLEGTEFLIAVTEEEAALTVFEGEVVVTNERGEINVTSGERVSIRAGQPPAAARRTEHPRDVLRWARYYAPILARDLPAANQRAGLNQVADPSFFAGRSARRLVLGRVVEARADIAQALALDPTNADAHALESIIALSDNDTEEALVVARRAVDSSAGSATALLALSYAQQAVFDTDGALASLEAAIEQYPENPIAWARAAELLFSVGDVKGALNAANSAVALDPDLSLSQTILGFAQLDARNSQRAIDSFHNAIRLDQVAPLPRLGLGLAEIQQGELIAGRKEIEAAIIFDPGNALLRSYVGKAYVEERRELLPQSQFTMAKSLDPTDPTPWLYDAILKQTTNRPVEALSDLEKSIELNDGRIVHRSRLLLDQDLATRSAGLGQIYRDLGFERLGLVEGWKSVNADPGNYPGHRLLADTYSTLPRHQIARVNELYQSQLLQPLNITPVPPQLAEVNLFVLDSLGPAELAFNEFHPLLDSNGLTFQGSGVVAGNGSSGEHMVVSGIHNRLSYSLGQFHFDTDGFRINNDLDNEVLNALVQFRPNHSTSLQAELRSTETEKGDLRMLFDPASFSAALRQMETADTVRLGLRRAIGDRADVLGSLSYQDGNSQFNTGPSFAGHGEHDSYKIEAQYLRRAERWQLIGGVSSLTQDLAQLSRLTAPIPVPPFVAEFTQSSTVEIEQTSAYGYSQIDFTPHLTATVGVSLDFLNGQDLDRDRVNPKLGLIWQPSGSTIVRTAAFRTLQGPFVSKQNIEPRLEPTQVAGFNQFYFGSEGEEAVAYAFAIDHKLSPTLYAGGQVSKRELDVPVATVIPPSPSPVVTEVAVEEYAGLAYVYWVPSPELAVSGKYQYEKFDNGARVLNEGFAKLRTHRIPLQLKYFHASGLSAAIKATYVAQQGDFERIPVGSERETSSGKDIFWVFDASISYRLLRRRGALVLSIDNLFDETFRFQDTDPENPRIFSERLVSLKFTLRY